MKLRSIVENIEQNYNENRGVCSLRSLTQARQAAIISNISSPGEKAQKCRTKTMIKSIEVPTWPEIEQRIAALSQSKQEEYNNLLQQYKTETAKDKPNHEKIANLITTATELLK